MRRSTQYSGVADRRAEVEKVKQELQAVVDAQPTQIHPDDREGYLTAILADLAPEEGAAWTSWPEEVHLLALTAIRILGRNPMGSKCLLTSTSISTLLFHSGLIPHVTASATASDATDGDRPRNLLIDARSPTAVETLKVLANLLVLHPIARKRVTRADGCRAVVRALAGKDTARSMISRECMEGAEGAGVQEGDIEKGDAAADIDSTGEAYFLGDDTPERVFLLARLLFLMTAGEDGLVRTMVDEEEVVNALVYHFLNLPPIPIHYDALTELFKAANNVVAAYSTDKAAWSDVLNPLIHAAIIHLHLSPLTSIAPPLTQIVHVLFSAPLNPTTAPLFISAPGVAPGSPTSAFSALTLGGQVGFSGAAGQVQSGMRTLFNKIGQLPGQIRGMTGGASIAEGSGGPGPGHGHGWAGLGLSGIPVAGEGGVTANSNITNDANHSGQNPDRPKTFRERMSFSSGRPSLASLSPPQHTSALPSTSPQSRRPSGSGPVTDANSGAIINARTTSNPRPALPLPALHAEPLALPRRIFLLLKDWMDHYLPSTTSPDSEMYSRTAIDEVLPPLLLLLVKACQDNVEGRDWVKKQLLPKDLDRSPEAGTLENRKGTLGGLLRLMGCTRFVSSKAAAGELIWVICDSDAATMSAEIGYGNAAGFLFHKGITQPPEGTITEVDEPSEAVKPPPTVLTNDPQLATAPTSDKSAAVEPTIASDTTVAQIRHPITSLLSSASTDPSSELSNMTPEEKEREAEKLFVLFKRMERNPVLSLGAETTTASAGTTPSATDAADSGERQGERELESKGQSIEELMRQKLESGEHARMDEQDELEERARREKEDQEDEEEVGREMAAYRARMGR